MPRQTILQSVGAWTGRAEIPAEGEDWRKASLALTHPATISDSGKFVPARSLTLTWAQDIEDLRAFCEATLKTLREVHNLPVLNQPKKQ